MTYAEKLKHPKWQKKRLEILSRDKFTCKKCGDKDTTLHVHHLEYSKGKEPWEYPNKSLITLCGDCHLTIESLKTEDHFKDAKFDEIQIHKSYGWRNKDIIIFASYYGVCSMEIYNENRDFIVGFNLPCYEVRDIMRIFRHTIKNV